MLAFVIGSTTNFNYDKMERKSATRALEKLKNLETATKKKLEKIQNFDFSDCYDFSDSEEKEGNIIKTALFHPNKNNLNSSEIYNRKANQFSKTTKNNNLKNKILSYKNIIKWLDVLSTIMIISGCFIAQRENENYQNENSYDRVEVIKLIRDLKDINWREINTNFSESQNYSLKISKSSKILQISKIINFTNYNVSYLKNGSFIENFDFYEFESLPIPHFISNDCNELRCIILALSLASICLIILNRYIEYIRYYEYMSNSKGK